MDDETKKRIAEIRAREQKASLGEWDTQDPSDASCGSLCTENGCHECHPTGTRWILGPQTDDDDSSRLYPPDAEFIAHARQDIPFLLDALEKAHAEIDRLAEEVADLEGPTPWKNNR